MAFTPPSANAVVVTINGITQNHPENYSTNGTILTFTDPPAANSVIRVLQQAVIGTSIVPIDGSVSTSKLADGSVTTSKLASGVTLSSANLSGGSINNMTIGGTTANTGAFTTLSASGAFAANGGATLGDASGDALTINSSAVSIPNGLNFTGGAVTLATALNVASGGTGLTSLTAGYIPYGNGTSAFNSSSFLTYDGTNLDNGATASARTRVSRGGFINFVNTTNTSGFDIGLLGGGSDLNAYLYQRANGFMAFGTNNTERMRIDSSGNLGIGLTSFSRKLTVRTADGDGIGIQNAAGTEYRWAVNLDNSFSMVQSGTAERLRVNTSGALVLQGGSSSSNGVGVAFPATQSASSDANTLDDYEEGTWLPTIAPSTGAFGSVTYNAARNGYYTKIGRVVHIVALVYVTSYTVGTAANSMRIGSLPFPVADLTQNFAVQNIAQYGGNGYTPSQSNANVFFRLEQGLTYGLVCLDTNTTFTDEAIGAFSTSGFLFRITATYITST